MTRGWKKQSNGRTPRDNGRTSRKDEGEYLQLASELRKKISIAKAELDRINEDRKMTKKGKNSSYYRNAVRFLQQP